MRFNTKAQEYEQLKADLLEKLAAYQQVVQQANYEDVKSPEKGAYLVNIYTNYVQSNAAFRAFVYKDKLHLFFRDDIE